jgi:hypothetical protein
VLSEIQRKGYVDGVTPQSEWEQRASEIWRHPDESGLSEEDRSREFKVRLREYAGEMARMGVDRREMESRARALLVEKQGLRRASEPERLEAFALLRILALEEIREGRTSDRDEYEFARRWALPPGGTVMRAAPRLAWLAARKEVLGGSEEPTV